MPLAASLGSAPNRAAAPEKPGAAAADLVSTRYKVEADYKSIDQAMTLIEGAMGQLQAAEDRLQTFLNTRDPTPEARALIQLEMAAAQALIASVQQGIGEAMDAIDGGSKLMQGYTNRDTGKSVRRQGDGWQVQGLKASMHLVSQLPVQPTAESIRQHQALSARYRDDLAAAEKTLQEQRQDGRAGSAAFRQLEQHVVWLKDEIGKTQLSLGMAEKGLLQKTRDDAVKMLARTKQACNGLCLELSAIKDAVSQGPQRRTNQLEAEIALLEDKMKQQQAVIDQANARLAGWPGQ